MSLLILIPLLMGVVAYWFPRTGALAVLLASQAVTLGLAATQVIPLIRTGSSIRETLGGTDRALNIELLATATSMGLVVLTGVLMLAASICALRFVNQKFVLLLLLLQAVLNGLFLTDDVFNLFVLLEVVTLVMVLLNLFIRERRSIYDALYYLIIQIIGMSFFLLGIAYLYRAVGQLSLSLITASIAAGMVTGTQLLVPMALMLTGLALKVGLFPLMSYIPRFYGNPGAPLVVLMLSSSLLSTAVLFWIARIVWAFSPLLDIRPLLLILGFATALGGAVKALVQRDARMLLAFSTVSQAGLMLIALGGGTALSERGFIAHLFAHALTKGLLFIGVGVLTEAYGTCDLFVIRERIWQTPLLGAAFAVGALSLIGFPLTAGGVSKYWIVEGAHGWLYWGIWLVNLGTTMVMARLLVPRSWLGLAPVGPSEPTFKASDFAAPVADGTPTGRMGLVPTYVQITLAALTLLVLLFGFTGLNLSITWLAFANKAWQILLLAALALFLTRIWPRIAPTSWYAQLQPSLTNALALPDACLAVAAFFAGVLLLSMVMGVA